MEELWKTNETNKSSFGGKAEPEKRAEFKGGNKNQFLYDIIIKVFHLRLKDNRVYKSRIMQLKV